MKNILVLSCFISFSLTAQPLWLKEGLVAHYPFDGTFNDVSGNGYAPTISEVTFATDRFGQADHAAVFSGQDSSFMEVEGLLNDYSLATVSIWVNWSGETTAHPSQHIFNKPRHITGNGLVLRLHTDLEDIAAIIAPTSQELGLDVKYFSLPEPMSWNHFVVVYDSQFITLYKDGAKVSSTSFSAQEFLSEVPFQIGRLGPVICCGNPSTWNFSGQLDDLRVYERALSEEEVNQLYDFESISGSKVRRAATVLPQVINGFLVGAEILDGGYGYVAPPAVTISGGGGSGAEAVAVVSAGRVTGIQVTSTGRGYTNDPLITVAPPPMPLARATAEAQIVNGFLVGIDLLDSGYGYTDPPEVTLLDSQGTGAEVVAMVEDGRVVGFEILNTGRGYSENTIIQIAPPPFAPEMSIRVKSIELNLHLVVGKSYVIEATDDFIEWTVVSDPFVADSEFMSFEFEANAHGKYYRVVEAP